LGELSRQFFDLACCGKVSLQTYSLGGVPVRVISSPAFTGGTPSYIPHGAMIVWRARNSAWSLSPRGIYDLYESLNHALTGYGFGFRGALSSDGEIQKLDRSLLGLDGAREICMRYNLMSEADRDEAVARFGSSSALGLVGEPILANKRRARKWMLMAAMLTSKDTNAVFGISKGRNPMAALASTVPARKLVILRRMTIETNIGPYVSLCAKAVAKELDFAVRIFSSLTYSLQDISELPVLQLPDHHDLDVAWSDSSMRVITPALAVVDLMLRARDLAVGCMTRLWPDPFLKYSRRIGVELFSFVNEVEAGNFSLARTILDKSLRSLDFLSISLRISEFKILFSRSSKRRDAQWHRDMMDEAIVILAAFDELDDTGFATQNKDRICTLLGAVVTNIGRGDYDLAYKGLRECLSLM